MRQTPFGIGQSGLYSDNVNVTFDNLKIGDGAVRNPKTKGISASVDASRSSGQLLVEGGITSSNGGEAVVTGFSDDYYVVQTAVDADGVDDLCDIALGISQDLEGNDVPDECEGKNRYISLSLAGHPGVRAIQL